MADSRLILLIEDNPTCAGLFRLILTEGFGCRVHWATDGGSARAFLATARPDLIQMDIQLPGESGWDMIRSFKADPRYAAIPIYVVTACGLFFKEELSRERALIHGEMEKPVAVSAYVAMVARLLRMVDAGAPRSGDSDSGHGAVTAA